MTGARPLGIIVSLAVIALASTGCEREEAVVGPQVVEKRSAGADEVSRLFEEETGVGLVRVDHDGRLAFPGDADDSSELSDAAELLVVPPATGDALPSEQARLYDEYGRFVITVVGDVTAAEEVLFKDVDGKELEPDSEGIYWERVVLPGAPEDPDSEEPEEIERFLAHKRYGDVIVTWLSAEMATNEQWTNLDRLLTRLLGPKGTEG